MNGENDEPKEEPGNTEATDYKVFREACEELWKEESKEPDADYEAFLEACEEIWETEGQYWSDASIP